MRKLMIVAVAALAAAPCLGQPAPGVEVEAVLAEHAAARFIGRWVGEGWMMDPNGVRVTYQVHERARWNLAGTAIVIEGLGLSRDASGEVVIGHDAMAVIRMDEESGEAVFIAGRGGDFAPHGLEVLDEDAGVMRWSPGGPVRFTITIDGDTWKEVGEYSQDGGETWTPFLGMTLERVDDEM